MTALPTVGDVNYPSAIEIRDNALRTIKIALARVGITVNVLQGSEVFARAESWARRAVIAFANNRIKYEDLSPLTATGDNLVSVAGIFGVRKRPASSSTGFVRVSVSGSVTVPIPAGFRGLAPNGELYETITVNTVPDRGQVELRAINAGAATNQAPLVKLAWTSSAIGALGPTCLVLAGGLAGGAAEDDEETLRRRLLDRLANPATDDNVARFRQLAEDASAAVWRAYAYQSVRGPATADVAVVAEGGDRTLSPATVATVSGPVIAALPGHADINITSVVAEPVNVVLLATLPLLQASGGAGGGWVDGTPWPSGTPVAGSNDAKVTAYSAGTATVRATSSPQVGRRIGIWNATSQVIHEYTVASVGGVSGAYTITVQGLDGSVGFKVSPLNSYVSAGATNLTLYAATFLALVEALGPGEKSESTDVLPRGRRQPTVSGDHPRDLDNRLLGALQVAHAELEVSYALRLDATSGSTRTSPSVPAVALLPPRILTLANFSVWKA